MKKVLAITLMLASAFALIGLAISSHDLKKSARDKNLSDLEKARKAKAEKAKAKADETTKSNAQQVHTDTGEEQSEEPAEEINKTEE